MNFENDHIEKEITRVKNEILYRNIKDYPDILVDLLIEFLSTTTSYIKIDLNKRSIECNIWINDSYQITIVSSYVFFMKPNLCGPIMTLEYTGVFEKILKIFNSYNDLTADARKKIIELLEMIQLANYKKIKVSYFIESIDLEIKEFVKCLIGLKN